MLLELEAALERVEQSLTFKEQEVRGREGGGGREGGREEGGEGVRGGKRERIVTENPASQDEEALILQREVRKLCVCVCVC